MASTDAKPIPVKNVAYRVTFPIFDADGDLVTGATGLDSEISKDAGTFTDCTNEATEIATSSGMYYLDLSSTEMNADCVSIIVKTSSSGAKTTPIVLYPQETGDILVDVQSISGDSVAADNLESEYDNTGFKSYTRRNTAQAGAAGTITLDASASATDDLYNGQIIAIVSGTGVGQTRLIYDYTGSTKVANVTPNWITNPSSSSVFAIIPHGRVDIYQVLGTAQTAGDLAALINAVDDYVDTEVAAIKAKTDNLPASPANEATLTTIASYIDTEVAAIKAKTDNLPSDPADASDIASSFSGVNTKLDTIDDFLDTEIAAIKAKTDNLPEGVQKNATLSAFTFMMVDSTDHYTPKTGLTVSAARSIDGGAFASCANSVTEIANGMYKIDLAAADLNGTIIALKFTATGADQTSIVIKTEV